MHEKRSERSEVKLHPRVFLDLLLDEPLRQRAQEFKAEAAPCFAFRIFAARAGTAFFVTIRRLTAGAIALSTAFPNICQASGVILTSSKRFGIFAFMGSS